MPVTAKLLITRFSDTELKLYPVVDGRLQLACVLGLVVAAIVVACVLVLVVAAIVVASVVVVDAA
jgi:hypothetical protein